jgi:tape measure domain-containing protein
MSIEVGTAALFDISQPLAALDRLSTADAKLRTEQLATNAAIGVSFASVASSVNQYGAQLSSVVVEAQRGAAAQQQFAREIAGLVKDIRDQTAATEAARQASAAAAAERRKATQAAREAAAAEKAAAKEVADAEKQVAAAARLAAKESAASAKQVSQSSEATGGLGKALDSLQGQVVAAFGVAAVKQFVGNVIEAGQAAEATLSKLTFANGGNAQAAARDFAFIRAEADRLGLEINSAGKSYGSFTAAAAAANFPLAEARKLFLATAGASATLKLSADDTQGVLLALTQVLSKGTVQAEELRGQIGERLPGAFAIAARSMGVTEQQLNKLLQTGSVKAADFLPKFAEELQKTFGDGTAAAADSFTANLARIENEFSAFFLRFQGAASKGTSALADIFRRFNEGLDLRSPEGRKRLGEQQAQEDIKNYEATLKTITDQAEAQAKANGESASQAVTIALARQRGLLNADLAAAKQEASRIEGLSVFEQLRFPGGRDALRNASVQAQRRAAVLDGEIAKLDELVAARKKADDPKDLDGLIKKQEDLIKALKLRQQAATQENQGKGGDFLFGKGGLNEELKAAEKELDRLLGKANKAAADRLAAALAALAAAREQLQSKAAAAATKDADDQAARARLAFEESIRQVGVVEQKLREAEARVRKAGGRGEKADGVIDGVQDKQLAILRVAALDKYYDELGKIELAREQRLFDLRAASDEKEVEAVDRRYDKLIQAAKDNIEKQAIEEARAREQVALRFRQQEAASAQTAGLATARVQEAGATFGQGTGISVIEAKQAEKRALLAIEKKHAEDVLNNSLLLGIKEGELARAQARATIARVGAEFSAIDQEKAKHQGTDSLYKLLFGENDSDELRSQFEQTAQQAIGAINQILSAQKEAVQQQIQAHQDNINSLEASLAAQIQLNKEGSASNIQSTLDQINAEKQAKKEALAESRAIAKQQQQINDLQAVSSISLAVANVIAGWSTVPLVGSLLGLVAAGAMLAAFIGTKSAAANAARTQDSFFTGGFTPDGGKYEEAGTVHKGEFVANQELTRDYRTLFKALHEGRPEAIDWDLPTMQRLLPAADTTGLLPNFDLPDQMRAEKAQAQRVQIEHSFAPLQAKFDALHAELTEIKGSNREMADKKDVLAMPDGSIVEKSKNGSIKRTYLGT